MSDHIRSVSSLWNNRVPGTGPSDRQDPQEDERKTSKSNGTRLSPPGLSSDQYQDRLDCLSSSDWNQWIGFLSIYGQQGVLLRELVMLVSALYFPVAEFCKYPHWSHDGNRNLADPISLEGLFLTTLKEASTYYQLVAMEGSLVALGIMTVKNAGQSEMVPLQDRVASTIWCVRLDNSLRKAKNTKLCRDLVRLYSQIP